LEKKLIVCADDFGLTCGVNKGIIDCYKYGILKSASVLANGPAFEDALKLSSKFPGLDLGIHLFLTEFKPICLNPHGKLIDSDGSFFNKYIKIIKEIVKYPGIIEQIKAEFRCQIECVLEKGIKLSHINSHKHLHIYPSIWKIVLELAQEYKIPFVRFPVENIYRFWQIVLTNNANKEFKEQLTFVAFCMFFRVRFSNWKKMNGTIKSPDNFCGLFDTGNLNELTLSGILNGLGSGVTELMCHPGYVDNELLRMSTRLLESREKEVAALCHSGVKKIINDNNIKVTSFHECY